MPHSRRWLEHAAALRLGSMTTLLFVLVLSVFVAPVAVPPDSGAGQIVEDILISLILVSGAIAVSDRRLAFIPLTLVAVVVIAVRWAGWFLPSGSAELRAVALLFALLMLALVISAKVFGKGAKVRDRLWGAIALYMLLGIIWAAAYEIVGLRDSGAYTGLDGHGHSSRAYPWVWIYFSFSTLTTVGYGDITPVARVARSLSNLEALIGQLYPAIVLARLVSLPAEDTKSDEE
ncbi:potassium channel family protein [Bordetella flabilis]|uniref:Potassium channel domain-containing protein n=1 Tax=Bordetella flabilis TaxID=463014 RepID=A0A193GJC8_9BORD|nr:potassium channel family protein [Bordetella flabilis]ANN79688.1 hypothetical protein BAU07_23495 [Bordetella flabilis]